MHFTVAELCCANALFSFKYAHATGYKPPLFSPHPPFEHRHLLLLSPSAFLFFTLKLPHQESLRIGMISNKEEKKECGEDQNDSFGCVDTLTHFLPS